MPPGGRFTLFDFFHRASPAAGLFVGVMYGLRTRRFDATVLGAAAGFAFGFVLGWVPWALIGIAVWCQLRFTSSESLRKQVQTDYFVSHVLIAELIRRGEPVESFREAVRKQLQSTNPLERESGEVNAGLWFPDLRPEAGAAAAEDGT